MHQVGESLHGHAFFCGPSSVAILLAVGQEGRSLPLPPLTVISVAARQTVQHFPLPPLAASSIPVSTCIGLFLGFLIPPWPGIPFLLPSPPYAPPSTCATLLRSILS